MQVSSTKIAPNKFKLIVEADEVFINQVKQRALHHMGSKHLKLPGFREGKAPLSLVEKNVDSSQLQQEFLEEAVNRLYGEAIREEKLRPIANPQIKITKFVPFSTLEFEAEVDAIGDIKLANYKNIKVEREKVDVTASDVSDVLAGLKKRQAERIDVSRVSKNGDELTIDFKGTDTKGQPVQGAEGKDYSIIIGSNTFIPGFEPNLIGLKKGEEKTFSIVFPKNYSVKALQSKKVTFWVRVGNVNELKIPKLDDDFAAKAGPFKTIAELKADIKKQIKAEREAQAESNYENKLISEIAAKSQLEVPELLIDEQVERSEQAEKQNLVYRGQTWQEHLKEEGVTEDEHRKRNRPEAELTVKAGLVLSEIAAQEGIAVAPEELEIRIQMLKSQYKDSAMQAELDKPENQKDIENRLLTEKTLAKLTDYNSK